MTNKAMFLLLGRWFGSKWCCRQRPQRRMNCNYQSVSKRFKQEGDNKTQACT